MNNTDMILAVILFMVISWLVMLSIMSYILTAKFNGNNRVEKEWVFKFFLNKIYSYRSKIFFVDKYFDYFNETLNGFLYCKLFHKDEKIKLLKFKNMLMEIKEKLEF